MFYFPLAVRFFFFSFYSSFLSPRSGRPYITFFSRILVKIVSSKGVVLHLSNGVVVYLAVNCGWDANPGPQNHRVVALSLCHRRGRAAYLYFPFSYPPLPLLWMFWVLRNDRIVMADVFCQLVHVTRRFALIVT